MRSLVLLVVLLLPACNSDIEITFDPCAPLAIEPGPGTQDHEVQSIEQAIDAWSELLPARLEVASDPTMETIPIRFDSGDTFYRAVYWDKRGEIWIGRDKLLPEDLALVIAHELGHAFGLQHVDSELRPSVMNVGNLRIAPNRMDGRAVRDLWESCQ